MIDKHLFVGVAHFAFTAVCLKLLGFILPCYVSCYYRCVANALLFLYIARFTFEYTKKKYLSDRIQPENRAVLITGCDSGFGHNLAKRLDSAGFHVFASCLFPDGEGAAELRKSCSKRLQIPDLDVTKDESVNKAVEFVKDNLGTSELWAVVNNAGIQKGFDVELTPMSDFKDTIEVNTFGPVRVTKAFLPMLRQSKGRVVNLTSICGRLSVPHATPYIMSKFAAVAFTECLKQEMDVWGIRVISIEPELFLTPMVNPANLSNRIEETFKTISADVKDDYGERYLKHFRTFADFMCSVGSKNISVVIDALESAVSLEHPESVYKPCRNILVQALIYFLEHIPKSVFDVMTKFHKSITGFPKPKEAENTL